MLAEQAADKKSLRRSLSRRASSGRSSDFHEQQGRSHSVKGDQSSEVSTGAFPLQTVSKVLKAAGGSMRKMREKKRDGRDVWRNFAYEENHVQEQSRRRSIIPARLKADDDDYYFEDDEEQEKTDNSASDKMYMVFFVNDQKKQSRRTRENKPEAEPAI